MSKKTRMMGGEPGRPNELIILQNGRVQVTGDVEELVESHKILVGPAREGQPIAGVATVVQGSTKGRQDTLVVRADGPIHDPRGA